MAGSSTAETITAGAREAQSTLVTASSDAANHVKSLAADVERSLAMAGSTTAETITAGAREAQSTLVTASSDAANHVKSLAVDVERSLAMAGTSTAEAITAGAREAQTTLVTASSDAANHVKSLATDVERTLTAVGSDTAASILASAREAQSSLAATSAEAASQIKAISGDVERSLGAVTAKTTDNITTTALNAQSTLVAASNEVSAKVRSTSAEVERSVLAASGSFGSAMTGKTDEIVTYVQQQADRLSQMIDSKRGSLVEALGSRTNQLTVEIDRVTTDALKSIETRGQGFSQSILSNGTDVARTITTAGEMAAGAVNKSLKDLEQASRSAIDQSRQVSVAAVTEMQETSKILRTDTVALFERLREGNILLQEVLTGAHDNLNSLERALVTRVADFVSAMNDVTSRNGTATQTLEDQLSVFNAKTSKALEDLGELSSQFEHHGQALVEAASSVEESNRNTTASVAERKSTLESLVTTIDLRTADLDQRLSRFTGLLDESLAAAESRARDIARVVAETAGAGSAAISRQFEAVRSTAEEERRLTAEAMTEIYQQSTQEADAMFKQSRRKVRQHGGEHEADGGRNAQRARSHAQRASPRRAGNAAGSRREHRADAQGDRRPDRGAGRTEPDRRPSWPRPRRRDVGAIGRATRDPSRCWRAVGARRLSRGARSAQRLDPAAAGSWACRPRAAPKRRRFHPPVPTRDATAGCRIS